MPEAALITRCSSEAELGALARSIVATDGASCPTLGDAMLGGEDPLGDAFCRLRRPELRRKAGAVYTPSALVEAMVEWARANGDPVRVVDPGAGSGRFLLAAARAFSAAELVAVETDPLAVLLLRANAAAVGLKRLRIVTGDYLKLQLPTVDGATLYLGNPPYVRHHDIADALKQWLADAAASLGHRASRLAGLHVHFLLKTATLARPGDYGAFVTSAQWLDANYGTLARKLLLEDLGGVALDVVAASARPFADAATTAAVLCFRSGAWPPAIRLRQVRTLQALAPLGSGRPMPRRRLERASRWSPLLRPVSRRPSGHVELGEICRVHRGQVTGCNGVWIRGAYPHDLPESVLARTVTRAAELLRAGCALRSGHALRQVVDLPQDLDALSIEERAAVERFLVWARGQGAQHGYVARHRRAWWAVGLKPPAPILCSYMARRPPAFVRNLCAARHINIAHGLYPREPMPATRLDALRDYLQGSVGTADGRSYAGDLAKFEPKDLERVLVPSPTALDAAA